MDNKLFIKSSDVITYSSQLIRYCTILNKWDFVCMKGLNLHHMESAKEEKDLERDYFNTSEILEEKAKEEEEKEETVEVLNTHKPKFVPSVSNQTESTAASLLNTINNNETTEVNNYEKKIFRDKCESLNLDSETLSKSNPGKFTLLILI